MIVVVVVVILVTTETQKYISTFRFVNTVVGTARSVERRTRDRKVSSSIAGRAERREIFFSSQKVELVCAR